MDLKIEYGKADTYIDVTILSLENFVVENWLHIPTGDDSRARVYGDPCPGILKTVRVSQFKKTRHVDAFTPFWLYLESNFVRETKTWLEKMWSEKLQKVGESMQPYRSIGYSEQLVTAWFIPPDAVVLEVANTMISNTFVIASRLSNQQNFVSLAPDEWTCITTDKIRLANEMNFHLKVLDKTHTVASLEEDYNLSFDTLVNFNNNFEAHYQNLKLVITKNHMSKHRMVSAGFELAHLGSVLVWVKQQPQRFPQNSQQETSDKLQNHNAQNLKGQSQQNLILHLVLFNPKSDYDNRMKRASERLYSGFEPMIRTYYYCFSNDVTSIEVQGNVVFVPGKETFLPGILDKTLAVMEFFYNNGFTYLVRSNISSLLDFDQLKPELFQLDSYGGVFVKQVCEINPPSGIQNAALFGTPYAQGICILLSPVGWDMLMKYKDQIDRTLIDDVAIGVFFFRKGVRAQELGQRKYEYDVNRMIDGPKKGISVYQFNCGEPSLRESIDAVRMEFMSNMLSLLRFQHPDAQRLKIQTLRECGSFEEIQWRNQFGWTSLNPSICKFQDEIIVNVRCVNHSGPFTCSAPQITKNFKTNLNGSAWCQMSFVPYQTEETQGPKEEKENQQQENQQQENQQQENQQQENQQQENQQQENQQQENQQQEHRRHENEQKENQCKFKRELQSQGGYWRGFEDLRLFSFRNKLHALATSPEFSRVTSMYLCTFDFKKAIQEAIQLQGPDPNRVEKNWLPLESSEELLAIYSFAPWFVVLQIDPVTGATREYLRREEKFLPQGLRGSAIARAKNCYYVIAHQVRSGQQYLQYILKLDASSLQFTHISNSALCITGDHNIEFVCGCVVDEQYMYISFGVGDVQARCCRLLMSDLESFFIAL